MLALIASDIDLAFPLWYAELLSALRAGKNPVRFGGFETAEEVLKTRAEFLEKRHKFIVLRAPLYDILLEHAVKGVQHQEQRSDESVRDKIYY